MMTTSLIGKLLTLKKALKPPLVRRKIIRNIVIKIDIHLIPLEYSRLSSEVSVRRF